MKDAQDKIVNVKVTAGARTENIQEIAPDTLKVRVQTPPEKGKANDRVIELLAQYYKTSASRISLLSGATSLQKRFLIR